MQRRLIFDANDLLKLIIHYTQGAIPLDATLKEVMVHPVLQRLVGMWVVAEDWPQQYASTKNEAAAQGALAPLLVRYEGRKVLSWGNPHEHPQWTDSPDAPHRQ